MQSAPVAFKGQARLGNEAIASLRARPMVAAGWAAWGGATLSQAWPGLLALAVTDLGMSSSGDPRAERPFSNWVRSAWMPRLQGNAEEVLITSPAPSHSL